MPDAVDVKLLCLFYFHCTERNTSDGRGEFIVETQWVLGPGAPIPSLALFPLTAAVSRPLREDTSWRRGSLAPHPVRTAALNTRTGSSTACCSSRVKCKTTFIIVVRGRGRYEWRKGVGREDGTKQLTVDVLKHIFGWQVKISRTWYCFHPLQELYRARGTIFFHFLIYQIPVLLVTHIASSDIHC